MPFEVKEDNLDDIQVKLWAAIIDSIDAVGDRLSDFIRRNIGTSGNATKVGKKWVGSSEPGGFPGVRRGRLRRSITHTTDAAEGSTTVGTNVVYAKALEFGIPGKLAARPYINRSYKQNEKKLAETFEAEFKRKMGE
jgi:phage gpG-like protein